MVTFKESFAVLESILRRNGIILTDLSQHCVRNRVNINWWRASKAEQNIGDMLSPVVVQYMLKKNGLNAEAEISKTKHLYAIGSIIDCGYQNAVVWGSGLLRGNRRLWWRKFRKLDLRCVRGPETRRTLVENGYSCPEVYGDPAVLLPLFYCPAHTVEYKYRVVPHHSENWKADNILSPITADWQQFVNELTSSKLIISSSLHGIILAEAYGVPAVWLKTGAVDEFKFLDYYHSTGRTQFASASSVEEALKLPVPAVPDLSALQQNLMNSFPTDLWK